MSTKTFFRKLLAIIGAAVCTTAQGQVGSLLWVYDAGAIIDGSPALGRDGTVYIAAGALIAVTNNGFSASARWVFAPLGAIVGSPVVTGDETIVVPDARHLYAITSGGMTKWTYSQTVGGSAAIGLDGTIYVQGAAQLWAISQEGILSWEGAGGGGSGPFCSPVLGGSGSVCIASAASSTLYCLTGTGTESWRAPFGSGGIAPRDSPAVGGDGTVYLPGGDRLYAFSPGGTQLWGNGAGLRSGSSAAIGRDGTIYVGAVHGSLTGYGFYLSALTSAGDLKWQVTTNLSGSYGAILGTPAIDAAGTIYWAAYTRLLAFDPGGRVTWGFDGGGDPANPSGYSYTSPAIGPNGTVYATFGSRLYAFAGTNALADSPWPMYRQNARHTGKVEKPSLQKPQKRSDANFQFELYAQTGQPYTIEASTNLNTWTSLTSLVATTLPTEVFDLEATNFPVRFYRARSDSPLAEKRLRR